MTVDLNTTNPLSFLEWKAYYEDISDASELSIRYNNYLIEWKDQKQVTANTNTDYAKGIYIQFINNLNLSPLDKNVSRFIERIDTDDIYELELSIHYFAEIIQSQLKNVRDLREEVKFSTTKNKLKTSKLGIQKYIKNYIARLLNSDEFIKENTNTNISDIDIQKIANSISVNLKNYIADEFVYNIQAVDKDLILNIARRVRNEVPNVLQLLSINKNGKQPKVQTNNISTPNSMLSINEPFTNFERLPGRYFRGENKTIDNLKFSHERGLIEKYLANDLYHLSGNKQNAKIKQLFNNTNPTNNLTQRYNPNLYGVPYNIKSTEIFPYQLSFKNTGTTNFYSSGLTFNINLSAFKGREYVVPNPHKYEPGVKAVGYIKNSKTGEILRNIKIKQRVPLIFKAKTSTYKNDTQGSSVEIYNNKLLRNYGYQSQENSLDYSVAGVNKREDNISFWNDAQGQIDWNNTDTYPISVLNSYPEASRLDDLLITNKTGIKLRSDVYGNEFYFIKPVYPKRYAGTTYIEAEVTTTAGCVTAAEYYDALYFNPLLSALSATEYESSGTLYSSVTGMYDEFIVNDSTLCSLGTVGYGATAWVGPLTDFSCTTIHTEALSCGSVSAVSAIDGGPFLNHPGTSTDLLKSYFTDTTVPYFSIDATAIYSSTTTTWELSTTNEITTSSVRLFDQQFISAGEIYVRNIFTQTVDPLSTAFVNVFNKHTTGNTKSNILSTSNILDFDVIENTIYIQTSAETVTELYDFVDGSFKNNASSKSIVT
tara:strand:+ start:4181 stop:6481 length:2301 start_codon:yes stop_codon:yes gene_type:complete